MKATRLQALVNCTVLALVCGCEDSQVRIAYDLKQTGLAYHFYHEEHQQGPPGWDELIAYVQGEEAECIRRVRQAGYSMKWNVKFSEVPEDLANTVLAEGPAGSQKLMMDGSVRQ